MPRTSSHVIETNSINMVKNKIDRFYSNGDALARNWQERDYGIDLVVELFNDGIPTGKIAFLQIKGTKNIIAKLKNSNEVSCSNVSVSSLDYAKQRRIPYILIYASISKPECFYYLDLQSVIDTLISKINQISAKSITVRIPHENCANEDLSDFFSLINRYYI